MRKLLLTGISAFLLIGLLKSEGIELGEKIITPGIGFGSALYNGYFYKNILPPLSVSFEQEILNELGPGRLGLGGYLGIVGSEYSVTGLNSGYNYFSSIIGIKGFYHYPIIENLDTYGVLMLGYNLVRYEKTGSSSSNLDIPLSSRRFNSLIIGARYYMNDQFGFMSEIGYGLSYVTFGISYKLK